MSEKDRGEQFRGYVAALNEQFLQWCTRQWESKRTRFWSSGMRDYLRHQAKIRLEFGDVIQEDDSTPSSSSGGTPPGNGSSGGSRGGSRAASPSPLGLERKKYEPLLSLTPYCNTKIIHFVRHGEGFHNIGISTTDSHLTERGWEQAHALGQHMYSLGHPTSGVQLVVVSPLMRALETAAGIFGMDPAAVTEQQGQQPEQQNSAGPQQAQLLMLAQTGEHNLRAAHGAVALRPGLTVIANELCRERLGPSPCDKRRSVTEARQHFPGVDFQLIESEEDVLWREGMVEGESHVVVRGMKFLEWVMQRPETNIAVVTHSAFLWFTLTCFGNEYVKPVRENLQRWYENCEMRTVVLSDGGGAGTPDRTWFRGGAAFREPQRGLVSEDRVASHPI